MQGFLLYGARAINCYIEPESGLHLETKVSLTEDAVTRPRPQRWLRTHPPMMAAFSSGPRSLTQI